MHILLFIPEKLSPKKSILWAPSSRGELGGRKSVSWCNNNLTFLWLVLLKIYTITLCVWTNEAKIACLFQSLFLPGHQILHCCPPWRLFGRVLYTGEVSCLFLPFLWDHQILHHCLYEDFLAILNFIDYFISY